MIPISEIDSLKKGETKENERERERERDFVCIY